MHVIDDSAILWASETDKVGHCKINKRNNVTPKIIYTYWQQQIKL